MIVDFVVGAIRQPGGDSTWLWILLAAEFGIVVLGAVLGRAVDYWDSRIADEFSKYTGLLLMRHAST